MVNSDLGDIWPRVGRSIRLDLEHDLLTMAIDMRYPKCQDNKMKYATAQNFSLPLKWRKTSTEDEKVWCNLCPSFIFI